MTKAKTLADTVSTGGPLATPGAVNLPGGAQGSVPYQSGVGQTALLAPGTAGHVLTSGGAGSNPTWAAAVTAPAGSTGQVQYNNAGAFGAIASGTSGQVLTSAGAGAAPTWTTPGGGSWVYLNSFSATGASYVDITGQFSSTYDDYVLIFENVKSSISGEQFAAQLYYGGSLRTGGYWEVHSSVYNGNTSNGAGGGASELFLLPSAITTDGTESTAGQMWFYNVNSASNNMFAWNTGSTKLSSGGTYGQMSTGYARNTAGTALTGIRIYWYYGYAFSAGTFRLYGIKKS